MKFNKILAGTISILFLFTTVTAYSMSQEAQGPFKVIMDMELQELGEASASLMNAKYPEAKWTEINFPNYVFSDQATEMAYKVAVKLPDLLGTVNVQDETKVIPCYCTCETFGHDNLLYCFFKKGDLENGFDDHGSQCAVCIRQALLAFLWDDLGATHAEIMVGMKDKFAPLIEKYHHHEH